MTGRNEGLIEQAALQGGNVVVAGQLVHGKRFLEMARAKDADDRQLDCLQIGVGENGLVGSAVGVGEINFVDEVDDLPDRPVTAQTSSAEAGGVVVNRHVRVIG